MLVAVLAPLVTLARPDPAGPPAHPPGPVVGATRSAPTTSAATSGRGWSTAARIDLRSRVPRRALPVRASARALGLVAGYYGGSVDTIASWLVNVVVAFPFFVLIIALVFALGPGTRNIYIAITLVGWVSYTRIVRGEVLVAKRREYVLAARAGGLSTARILVRHLLPNVITQAIVFAMSDIVLVILAIVTLGYLGLGVPAADAGLGPDDRRRARPS